MVDFILITFNAAVFAAGFWCGAKFKTLAGMKSAAKDKLSAWLKPGA